jgi:hypothetical protein
MANALQPLTPPGSPAGYITGLSGFEGVSDGHVIVQARAGVVLNQDFNAWEDTFGRC